MKKIKLLLLIICFNNVTNYSFAQCSSKIKCGAYHSSILKTDGTIWAFGFGGLGNLGNGNDSNSLSQISLGIGTSWIQIENGTYNSFSIKNDGTLWGTGYNLYGQLGINATTEYLSTLTQIGTAINWKEVVSSDGFTIGLKTNNTLWGWGQNNNYQMGDGTCCANRLAPGQIGTATDWKEIAVSQVNSGFAIKNNGTLWCWGSNIAGLIGDNLQPSVPFPIQHNTDTDW
ncbi:RCC1 domain-containing protein, partial [Flavobacterium sp.]